MTKKQKAFFGLSEEAEEWIKDHSGLIGSYKFVKYDYDSLKQAYLASAKPREKRIAELEKENAVLERRIERAKECMKKLLFIINSDPANYNCKGLVQDAENFIYNRTCNIRQQGKHCITEERCIMCDK